MYEGLAFSDQHNLYVFLEREEGDVTPVLVFDGGTFKLGAPNDEALNGHPLFRFGLGFYGLYEVMNSPWIRELCEANRVHPNHSDAMFADKRHFIATFKDMTLEVVCRGFEAQTFSQEEIVAMITDKIIRLGA